MVKLVPHKRAMACKHIHRSAKALRPLSLAAPRTLHQNLQKPRKFRSGGPLPRGLT